MENSSTISVIGTGYVGLTTATLLAEAGHTVYAIDINPERLQAIREGHSFFYEEGIDALINDAVNDGRLIPTDSYADSIPKSRFIFSCVGTPDNPDGSSNLQYIFSAAKEAAKYIKNGAVYIQKSTVPVGTGARVEKVFTQANKDVSYVSNPEFLREGTAISDMLWFDRIVVGGKDAKALDDVIELYQTIDKHRSTIAHRAGLVGPEDRVGKYIRTNRNSAELIKVTANAFLALKISFANSIAKLADQTGADVNDSMPGYIANQAKEVLGTLSNVKVAVLGLAFKPGTSDARRSPGVKLANILSKNGAKVTAYDPKANGEAKEDLRKGIKLVNSWGEAVKGVQAVFVATDWPEFLSNDLKHTKELMSGQLFVDCMNAFSASGIEKSGLKYLGTGKSNLTKDYMQTSSLSLTIQ
jgi:UDPglucose 6-dehydrogenase